MQKIIYSRPDGGVSIVRPIRSPEDESDDVALQRALKNDVIPGAVNVRIVDELEIPEDRTFRNAWEDTGAVSVNMGKAREIHKEKLRKIRQPLLEKLDVSFMRADETGNEADKQIIAGKKQALRDVTSDPAIASAKTPDELKSVIPAILLQG